MNTDLNYKLTFDKKFISKFNSLITELDKITAKARTNPKYNQDKDNIILQLMKMTNYNIGPFLGYYFPKYPTGKTPMSLRDYPFSYTFYDLNIGASVTYRGSRQISKTTGLVTRQSLNARLINGWRSFTITPHSDQIKTYADKLKEAVEGYRFNTKHSNYRQNLYFREFHETNATIKLMYILTDASKVRGNTTDELIYEEAQDFDPDLETEVSEIQSASMNPVTIYSGTSLTTDTFLEYKYQESSKAVFMLPCKKCGHVNHPTIEGDVLDMIQPDGPSCIKCGSVLNVYNGWFEHTDAKAHDCGFFGYHIPKIIVPAIANDPRKWNRIYVQKKRSGGSHSFFQEVLGIPTEEGAKELTEAELAAICDLGDRSEVHKNARNKQYRYVVSGCDWGGSEHRKDFKIKKSFTAHVMIGVTTSGRVDIISMDRYEGMNYKEVLGNISKRHNEFFGVALASDYGGGQLYNTMLREYIDPTRHWVFTYSSPNSKFIGVIPDSIFNHFTLNKTESITSLFMAIKQGRIHCYNWEQAKPYLSECLSIYRAPHETNDGKTYLLYRRHPAKPDDIAQALNLAFIASRLYVGESLFEDKAVAERVQQILMKTNPNLYFSHNNPHDSPYGDVIIG